MGPITGRVKFLETLEAGACHTDTVLSGRMHLAYVMVLPWEPSFLTSSGFSSSSYSSLDLRYLDIQGMIAGACGPESLG